MDQTLTADPGTWTGDPAIDPSTGYSYQWQRCEEGTPVSSIFGTTGAGPRGIIVDPAGNVYTSNQNADTVTKLLPDGTAAPSPWPVPTGDAPRDITIDSAGNIYTANRDSDNITKITPGGVATTTASGSTGDEPSDIAVDSSGNIYTANYLSGNVTKLKPDFTPADPPWPVSTGLNSEPRGITLDSAGNVYTANSGSSFRNVTIITPGGVPTTSATSSTGSTPIDIALDSTGNIYTANSGSPSSVSKLLPDGTPAGSPWPASTVVLTPGGLTGYTPSGIKVDSSGNIYTSNLSSANVTKITPEGVSSIFGTTGNSPNGLTLDSLGNVYTANLGSNNVTKITSGLTCTDISGADEATYTVTGADESKKIRVRVTGTNSQGSASANSLLTATVGPKPASAPTNTAAPTISGTPEVGSALTAEDGVWTGNPTPTFTYQWQRCDASGNNCTDIAGATSDTYTPTSADEGKTIRVKVTATNSQGSAEAFSEAKGPVPVGPGPGPNPGPTPSGKPKLGVSVSLPKKARAGRAFTVTLKTTNTAQATVARAVSSRAATTATNVRTCVNLSKRLFVVRENGGKVSGRTICWTRSSLAAGKSATYQAKVRSSMTMSGSVRIEGTATASNSSGATVKASSNGRLRVVKPARPKPEPPTG